MERQALLDMPDAGKIEALWIVTGTHVEVQPDKLKRIETWLLAQRDGEIENAVLIDFVPVATGTGGSPFLPGETLAAELVFYPSATPLRALIGRRLESSPQQPDAIDGMSLNDAIENYERLRAIQPWLGQWPLTANNIQCRSFGKDGVWIGDDTQYLPVHASAQDDARALCGVTINTITGLWDGRFFAPMLAQTTLGQWVRQ
jgi:hypothetical protein